MVFAPLDRPHRILSDRVDDVRRLPPVSQPASLSRLRISRTTNRRTMSRRNTFSASPPPENQRVTQMSLRQDRLPSTIRVVSSY